MGKRLCEAGIARCRVAGAGARGALALFCLFACLCVAGCANPTGNADDDRRGGFYGGVSGGSNGM